MEQINVEQIMAEIRKDAADKGMARTQLKFADVSSSGNSILDLPEEYDYEGMKKNILRMNAAWETSKAIQIRGVNKIKLFIKRILYKMVMTVVRPAFTSQDIFNSNVANTFNQISFMADQVEELKKECESLRNEVQELRDKYENR